MPQANVHRLAGFFRAFRDTMNDLRGDTESRVGILTPGRLNDTYFEHAYIARYLGFMLLEGEDLTVRERPGDGAHDCGARAGERAVAAGSMRRIPIRWS